MKENIESSRIVHLLKWKWSINYLTDMCQSCQGTQTVLNQQGYRFLRPFILVYENQHVRFWKFEIFWVLVFWDILCQNGGISSILDSFQKEMCFDWWPSMLTSIYSFNKNHKKNSPWWPFVYVVHCMHK